VPDAERLEGVQKRTVAVTCYIPVKIRQADGAMFINEHGTMFISEHGFSISTIPSLRQRNPDS
jgi:hypothetical protein